MGGAYNCGTIFRVTPSGSFKVLWNFNNPNKIHECQHPGTGPLLKDKEGNFYGTTKWGGRSDWGTVFKLTLHSFDMQASTAPPANSPSGATSQPAQTEQAQGSAPRDDFKTAKQKLIAHDAAHHEYTAAEAPKHIGETATVVGKVGCVDAGRTFHCLPLDGCMPNSPFWIIVNDDASGPELNVQDLKGVTIAVSGKIENRDGQPWLIVKSTTQIQPRTSLNTDYISRAHQKEADGDVDGAIELFGRAIEHQPDRRAEAYEFRGRAKERKGDWNGALADYDALVAVDPNKADFYYIRATQKKQHGQFEAAMADYQKAAELRSSPSDYIQMGNWRKEKGDITGAAAEYDKAIALCDRQIAGTGKSEPRSPLGSDPYFSRGCARELKGDLDGAVADYTQAIANNPARAAMAYGARGNIRRARGDLSGAIADYQHKYQITHYPDDEEKLKKAKAEGKKQRVANSSEANAPAEAPAGEKQTSPGGYVQRRSRSQQRGFVSAIKRWREDRQSLDTGRPCGFLVRGPVERRWQICRS